VAPSESLLDEVVRVELLDDEGLGWGAADVVEDHEAGEGAAVHEDDLRVDLVCVVHGFACERACRDEDALSRPTAVEGADELVDLGTADGILPPLGLQVDRVEAEAVFVDDAVDALVGPP